MIAAVIAVRRATVARELASREQQRHTASASRRARPPKPDSKTREERERRSQENQRAQEVYNLLVSLPTMSYGSAAAINATRAAGDPDADCAICLATLKNSDKVKLLPCHSGHVYHSRCLRKWFETGNSICPTCRCSVC